MEKEIRSKIEIEIVDYTNGRDGFCAPFVGQRIFVRENGVILFEQYRSADNFTKGTTTFVDDFLERFNAAYDAGHDSGHDAANKHHNRHTGRKYLRGFRRFLFSNLRDFRRIAIFRICRGTFRQFVHGNLRVYRRFLLSNLRDYRRFSLFRRVFYPCICSPLLVRFATQLAENKTINRLLTIIFS
jgi:hypothetical protein